MSIKQNQLDSTLSFGGGIVSGVSSLKAADYQIVSGDNGYMIPVDTNNLVVINLPQLSGVASGFNVIIKDTIGNAANKNISVLPYAGDLIDGGDGGDFISGAYQGFVFVSNGTEWKKLAFTSAAASGIRGIIATGRTGSGTQTSSIEYINASTLGNGASFGSVLATRDRCSGGPINNSTRSVFGGGATSAGSPQNTIEYVTVPTLGNSLSFGTLVAGANAFQGGLSNSTRGIFFGPSNSISDISHITIATTGNSVSFGTLLSPRDNSSSGGASSTRGVIGGGYNGAALASIEYITIASLGNGVSFGNLVTARMYLGGISNLTRAIFVGGIDGAFAQSALMEYITIATLGNAASFGNLYSARNAVGGFTSSTRGIFMGGIGDANACVNNIGYVTMSTTSNTTSFGTLTTARGGGGVGCNFAK